MLEAATLAFRAEALAAHMTVLLPDGEGPFPAVLQLHGCGGRKSLQDDWAEAFRMAGFAAVVVDSFAPRGIGRLAAYTTVCTGMRLQGAQRAGDLYAAFDWVKRQTWADPAKIAVAGWSHGGWTALDALALRPRELARVTGIGDLPEDPLSGLCAAVAIYPYLGVASRAARCGLRPCAPPVLALLATADVIVGWQAPKRVLERLRAAGTEIDIETLEGATHAFDEAEASDLRARYDPVMKAKAQALAIEWLRARFTR